MYEITDNEGFLSRDYCNQLEGFLDFAFSNERSVERKRIGDEIMFRIRCPFSKCRLLYYRERDEVNLHLMRSGFMPDYTIWWAHGESFNAVQHVGQTSNKGFSHKGYFVNVLLTCNNVSF